MQSYPMLCVCVSSGLTQVKVEDTVVCVCEWVSLIGRARWKCVVAAVLDVPFSACRSASLVLCFLLASACNYGRPVGTFGIIKKCLFWHPCQLSDKKNLWLAPGRL